MRTIATAGHVDHGKSSLVRALTGTDPDRFPEEKTRQLTIDLGFAFAKLPSGEEVGFVDVPGHVRFIKNMLAGVGAVELAMLVVAASEGWMPQTEEHLRILELLDARGVLVVLTKADLVDDEMLDLARLELDEHVAQSRFADATVVTCDSRSGRGLDDVRHALDALVTAAPLPADRNRPRLWVDRVFAARGAGTVVTGTLAGGALHVDDEVEVGSRRRAARVRGIETANRPLLRAAPGTRVALNLGGIDHDEVTRGDAVVRPGQWLTTDVADVALHALGDSPFPDRATVHVHVGSGEHRGRLRVLDPDRRFGRLRFDVPVLVAPGDRLVVRESGRNAILGGAAVLEVAPAARAKKAAAQLELPPAARLLAGHPWLVGSELGARTGFGDDEVAHLVHQLLTNGDARQLGPWIVSRAAIEDLHDRARELVQQHHAQNPLGPGLAVTALAMSAGLDASRIRLALESFDDLTVERGEVRLSTHQRTADSDEARALVAALDAQPFSPPDPSELGAADALVRTLIRDGVLVDLDGIVFTARAVADARARVEAELADRGALTVADARDLLDSTRKFVLAILSRLDDDGVTRREGDSRVAGRATVGR